MADNLTTTTTVSTVPSGTVIATDDVSGAHYQLVKVVWGENGTATQTSASDPMPVTATQSGTWNITNISGTISLPTGAATAAKQPALGTAGSASSDVISVQGIASMTAIQVADNGGSLTVDGSVTANAGTNLNTSALALESGGNLAGAATSLAVLDDWDESDRAKVNPIAGQAGVAGGSGTIGATTQRVTVATDDTVATDLTAIKTAAQLIDDTVYAEDVAAQAADKGVAILAVRRDADTSLVGTDNDYANLQVDANGYLKVEIFDGGASHTVDDGGSSLTIDGTVTIQDGGNTITVDNGGTFAVQESGAALTALQLIDDTVFAEDTAAQAADKGIAILAVRRDADTSLVGTDNDYANLQVDANGYLKVEIFDGGGSHTVDNGGTFAVQESGGALTALQIIDDWDESDRAKVNPIVGQAGVAGGAGAVGATTQRVVHGSASSLATTQNALSTSAEEVIASNSSRLFAEVKNADDAINVYIGDDNTVTASNGHLLRPGEALAFETYTGAIWAIAASGTPTVTTIEW